MGIGQVVLEAVFGADGGWGVDLRLGLIAAGEASVVTVAISIVGNGAVADRDG